MKLRALRIAQKSQNIPRELRAAKESLAEPRRVQSIPEELRAVQEASEELRTAQDSAVQLRGDIGELRAAQESSGELRTAQEGRRRTQQQPRRAQNSPGALRGGLKICFETKIREGSENQSTNGRISRGSENRFRKN